jgi:hypothetical protein
MASPMKNEMEPRCLPLQSANSTSDACCGQSWEKLNDGTNVPKSSYGLQTFKKETSDLKVLACQVT